jgi:hypothetical protein
MRADDAQPIVTELLGPECANEEGHIAAGFCEPGAKVAANRAGANNEDSHSHVEILVPDSVSHALHHWSQPGRVAAPYRDDPRLQALVSTASVPAVEPRSRNRLIPDAHRVDGLEANDISGLTL